MNIKELLQKRGGLIRSGKEILDAAGSEKRGLTTTEETKFDEVLADIDKLDIEINKLRKASGEPLLPDTGIEYNASNFGDLIETLTKPTKEPVYAGMANQRSETPGIKFYNKKTLPELRNRIAGISDMDMDSEELNAGRFIAGIITGNWTNREAERRALGTTTDGGGYFCPAPISGQLIEMALNKTKVIKAGAQVILMDTRTLTIPKITKMPEVEFKAENAEFSKSMDMTFTGVILTPKTLMGMINISVELAEDGLNIEQAVENAITDALALEMDRAILNGSGGVDILGIAQTVGVLAENLPAPIVSYAPFSNAHAKIEAENGTVSGMIAASSIYGDLDGLVSGVELQPLNPPQSWSKYDQYSSNQLTDMAIQGDWSKLLIGMRTNTNIEVTRNTTDAMKKLQVWIRGYLRVDAQIALNKHFCVISLGGSGSVSPSSSMSSSESASQSPSASLSPSASASPSASISSSPSG